MIIIKTKSNDFEHKYRGNIKMGVSEEFLIIEGRTEDPMSFDEYRWDIHVWDKFWLDDIKSITGVTDDMDRRIS